MNQIRRHHFDIVVWVGLLSACGLSQALGLGQTGSRVTMGEGLAFTVPLRLEAGEHIDDECVSADVFFGDDKVSDFNVGVTVLKGSQGPSALQVLTTSKVNEPVVTVNVSAGCASRMSRRYVVLADPPGLPRVSDRAGAQGPEGLAQLAGQAPDAQVGRPVLNRRARPAQPSSGADSRALSLRWSAPATASAANEAPRLQPAPAVTERLVLSGMRMATTMDMPSSAEDNSPDVQAQRASASAHWWALQATPSQLALEQARLLDLERRVAELQDWRPPAEAAPLASSEPEAAPEAAPKVASAPRPAVAVKGPDPDEVNQIRLVGLAGVAFIGLLAWGVQHWRRRAGMGEDLAVQEPGFSLPPPSWMAGRR